MTFRDQKLIESKHNTNLKYTKAFQRLRYKPFWLWDATTHREKDRINKGDCCFNHIIGLPSKDEAEKPMFDYERETYWALQRSGYLTSYPRGRAEPEYSFNVMYQFKEKHVWIKKATGLGVTEFMLRFMSWLCVRDDDYQGSQMVIVTGPKRLTRSNNHLHSLENMNYSIKVS